MTAHAPDLPILAFQHDRLIADGPLSEGMPAIHTAGEGVTVFDAATGKVVDLDLRASVADCLARLAPAPAREAENRGRGRPKLGVVAREVTLLPRHWEWLSAQPGGASVQLRKLVEAAIRADAEPGRLRQAREAAYRLMTTLAGDRPGYEEAVRSLFAGDGSAMAEALRDWPADYIHVVQRIAQLTPIPTAR